MDNKMTTQINTIKQVAGKNKSQTFYLDVARRIDWNKEVTIDLIRAAIADVVAYHAAIKAGNATLR